MKEVCYAILASFFYVILTSLVMLSSHLFWCYHHISWCCPWLPWSCSYSSRCCQHTNISYICSHIFPCCSHISSFLFTHFLILLTHLCWSFTLSPWSFHWSMFPIWSENLLLPSTPCVTDIEGTRQVDIYVYIERERMSEWMNEWYSLVFLQSRPQNTRVDCIRDNIKNNSLHTYHEMCNFKDAGYGNVWRLQSRLLFTIESQRMKWELALLLLLLSWLTCYCCYLD